MVAHRRDKLPVELWQNGVYAPTRFSEKRLVTVGRMKALVSDSVLVLMSTLVGVAGLEVALRQYDSETISFTKNFQGATRDIYRDRLPVAFDPHLGWVPQSGYSGVDNQWGKRVTIHETGIRSNGSERVPLSAKPPIIAAGDSFTFGDEVSDWETWPAVLEELGGRQVVNGGVFAYGIDQTYLRLRKLINNYRAEAFVFSFIPADIRRSEFATTLGQDKPYFAETAGGLEVMDSHIAESRGGLVRRFQRLLGYSYLLHKLMMRLNPDWWLQGKKFSSSPIGITGDVIACHIFSELSDFAKKRKVKGAYVLVQDAHTPDPHMAPTVDRVVGCAESAGLTVIDLRPELTEMRETDRERYDALYNDHMTAAGNAWVARRIWKVISRRSLKRENIRGF